jgi:hypothetical protein
LSNKDKKVALGLLDTIGYKCELHNMQDVMCMLQPEDWQSKEGVNVVETPSEKGHTKHLEISVDGVAHQFGFDVNWRAENSALLACLHFVIQDHQCERLVQAVERLKGTDMH